MVLKSAENVRNLPRHAKTPRGLHAKKVIYDTKLEAFLICIYRRERLVFQPRVEPLNWPRPRITQRKKDPVAGRRTSSIMLAVCRCVQGDLTWRDTNVVMPAQLWRVQSTRRPVSSTLSVRCRLIIWCKSRYGWFIRRVKLTAQLTPIEANVVSLMKARLISRIKIS